MGSLPGKPEKNPKESCNVVFSIASPEIELSDHGKEEDEIERLIFGTEFGEVERFVVATAEAQIVKDAARKVEATNLQRAELKAEKQDKLPSAPHQRVPTKAQKKVLSKFRKDLSDVGVRLPEISGMREAHVQMMLINDILDHQAEVAELLDIFILKIDPPIPPKSLPKLESQGMFTLPCYLGIKSMEPNTSSLQFGDFSSTTPIGLIKDFPLKIGACTIPIDLTVLKMTTEKRVPLILGTPFLTTVGACIDFANKKMNAEYCGTITCGASSIEKSKAEGVVLRKKVLLESPLKSCVMSTWKSAKKKEVSRATKAAHDKKKIVKEPHPPPLDKTPHTLTLHPMKLKDRPLSTKSSAREGQAILKCKGHHHSSAPE
ncbi:PREDICTED: uncharacterized protein LOC106314424 [Brassica oleracea var. oleracea]|uniref:uncharacterized protein LOC106314424 n=1 Tax=Brassica oleracea var. oleracea TaxID=109376 RepID=UPI0006A717D3|nr:PREDICTED: uncharacterized protein LOC106314424 [Brassica oleracea var. oleracea]